MPAEGRSGATVLPVVAAWSGLVVSLILSALGVYRGDGILLILAGVLSLEFCLLAVLSIGPLVSILPFMSCSWPSGRDT